MLLMHETFERFAEECGLRLAVERLGIAPRNLLAPPSETEPHFLVELSCSESSAAPVRLIFVKPITPPAEPGMREVLWWLASDAWVLEQGERDRKFWAAAHGYPLDEEATTRFFEQQIRQAEALVAVLGEVNYRRLLALAAADMAAPRTR